MVTQAQIDALVRSGEIPQFASESVKRSRAEGIERKFGTTDTARIQQQRILTGEIPQFVGARKTQQTLDVERKQVAERERQAQLRERFAQVPTQRQLELGAQIRREKGVILSIQT